MNNKIAKLTLKITFLALMAVALVAAPAVCRAQDSTNTPSGTPPPKKHSNVLHGKVASVDATAMTFTVGDSTLVVGSETKIFKNGQPGVFADITEGQNVSVAYKKDDAGKMNATSVRIGQRKRTPPADGGTNAPPAQ